MTAGELVRPIRPRALPSGALNVEADPAECAALARRFSVTAIRALTAAVDFDKQDGAVLVNGTLRATIEQPCAVTQDDFIYTVEEPLELRFVPAAAVPEYSPDEEIELDAGDIDEIPYEGESFDLGEALAQTLALAIDPYKEGPQADEMRKKAGIVSDENVAPSGPLAEALAALKKD